MKLFTDPAVIILCFLTAGLWVTRELKNTPGKKWGWWALLSGTLLFYLLSIYAVVATMGYALEKDYLVHDSGKIRDVDVIVVLGGGSFQLGLQQRRIPSHEGISRLVYGLEMLETSGAEHIVFTGGGKMYSDAKIVADAAERLGIDRSRMIIEPKARNTWEHPIELTKYLKDRKMKLGIVTAASHMKRSLMVFNKYYPNTVPMPSSYIYKGKKHTYKSFMPKTYNFYRSSVILHEVFGLLWYSMKGLFEQHENTLPQPTL